MQHTYTLCCARVEHPDRLTTTHVITHTKFRIFIGTFFELVERHGNGIFGHMVFDINGFEYVIRDENSFMVFFSFFCVTHSCV